VLISAFIQVKLIILAQQNMALIAKLITAKATLTLTVADCNH